MKLSQYSYQCQASIGECVPLWGEGSVTPLSHPGERLYPGTETVLVEPQMQADQCGFLLGHGTVEQLFTIARVL